MSQPSLAYGEHIKCLTMAEDKTSLEWAEAARRWAAVAEAAIRLANYQLDPRNQKGSRKEVRRLWKAAVNF